MEIEPKQFYGLRLVVFVDAAIEQYHRDSDLRCSPIDIDPGY